MVQNVTTGQWATKTVDFGEVDFTGNGTFFYVDRLATGSGSLMDLPQWVTPEYSPDWNWLAAESSRWDGVLVRGDYFDSHPSDVREWSMWCPDSPTELCSIVRSYSDRSIRFIWNWWNGSWADDGI